MIHIIAEAGTNHNGELFQAKKLVDVAILSQADSVKFQIIYPEGLYLPKIFENGHYTENEVFKLRQKSILKDQEYVELADYCRENKIEVSASVFDKKGLDLLDRIKAPYVKIASCDLNNIGFIIQAAERNKKLIISTGMSSLNEIEETVETIAKTGNEDIVLLHCVSVYPAQTEMMNLGFIQKLKAEFGFPVGLSDHTENSTAALVAVGLGVQWIEKHITINRQDVGFDHAYATEPDGFAQYVMEVRSAEDAIKPQETKIGKREAEVIVRARRSIYAARHIGKGDTITESDLMVVRPEGPLAPKDISLILGKKAQTHIRQYAAITLDMVNQKV